MKTAPIRHRIQKRQAPPPTSTPLKRTTQIVDFYDDIDRSGCPSVTQTPEPADSKPPLSERRPVILGAESMQIPISLMRMIEHELREENYDLRTVFNHCRGLVKGTSEFNDAYVAARILNHSRFKKHSTNVQLIGPCKPMNPDQTFQNVNRELSQTTCVHPAAVMHLGHLMRHFGIWVIFLLGLQFWAAWLISAFMNEFLIGGRYAYLIISLSLMMVSNAWVWFHQRGKLSETFHAPGAALFLLAVLPIALLYLRHVLSFAD